MKSTQSGFAIAGVALVMVAILAGSAYVFRNAGTSEDLVAQVSRSVKGKNTGPGGSGGSGTRPCPAECKNLHAKALLEAKAYEAYWSSGAYDLMIKECKTNPESKKCKQLRAKDQKVESRYRAAAIAYMNCVNRLDAHKYCPVFDIAVAVGGSHYQWECDDLKQSVKTYEERLASAVRLYKECIVQDGANSKYCQEKKYFMIRDGWTLDQEIYRLRQGCPQYASEKYFSSQQIIDAILKSK